MLRQIYAALLCTSAICVFASASRIEAQNVYFPNNITLNEIITLDSAIVGYANDGDYNADPRRNPTSPTITLATGGHIRGFLRAYNSSTVNVDGGSVDFYLYAFDNSTVNITNSFLNGNIEASHTSTVTLSNSYVPGYIQSNNSSRINITSGFIEGDLFAMDNGTFNISGGVLYGDMLASGASTMNLFGTGLTAVPATSPYPNSDLYLLSGTLADGTILDNKNLYLQSGTGAHFFINPTPVPEPGSMAFLLISGITSGIVLKRRYRK